MSSSLLLTTGGLLGEVGSVGQTANLISFSLFQESGLSFIYVRCRAVAICGCMASQYFELSKAVHACILFHVQRGTQDNVDHGCRASSDSMRTITGMKLEAAVTAVPTIYIYIAKVRIESILACTCLGIWRNKVE